MPPKASALKCTVCQQQHPRDAFSSKQLPRATRKCKACVADAAQRSGASRAVHTGLCRQCGSVLPWSDFPVDSRHSARATCYTCSNPGGRPHNDSFYLGDMGQLCPHCGARLCRTETTSFCCSGGKLAVDFAAFFATPDDALKALFREHWPLKDDAGTVLCDSHTSAALRTGFGALSRRFNNVFALAQHEIQSSGADKEMRFGGVLRPSNIRIHGTMYRKVFSAADSVPLRYLIVDPQERATAAKAVGLPKKMLTDLERLILPQNAHMRTIQRLAKTRAPTSDGAVVLEWHEGVNEVAGIVDFDPSPNRNYRSVSFRRARTDHPEYLHPLSPLCEPLSYPLRFPAGGRGWSTDVTSASGSKVTQMWWYRQQLLRFDHMHMCGRLLNEWLINMFCRMEDERFSHLRDMQHKRIATRKDLCEVVANETAGSANIGKKYYLPASVPGSPRHPRKLRTDALELARRMGPPTFFITLTCNPYWAEIQAALYPGQTPADRPDITVRVFHGRLAKMVAYLKDHFCGRRKYMVKVIEYQRRGLPHAHIVLCVDRASWSPEEVDNYVSCELPRQDAQLRALVLRHMIHSCNHSCRPQDPAQDCIKGCPWPFSDTTQIDLRGYPIHRRRPCGGHCPNCQGGGAPYGRRALRCNRLIVEYNADILKLWDGHANVKFAGTVELFEYLYKYLFKGPDKASYDVTLDSSVQDELKEWLRGRYLCATECAWRIFGYHTYDRWPHVVCLPVHLEGEDWVQYEEGAEEAAVQSHVSALQRYFYRPTAQCFANLRYHEYFENYMVSPRCPVPFRAHFPALFPEHRAVAADCRQPDVALDRGPPGNACFVYPRQRGEAPLCRLEMKYPRQKEVFYLRHMLLNYPKGSFSDCKRHSGKTYSSHEEAMLATGHFARSDEAHAVLDELIDLKYTAAQLRFAFLVLLEQEAAPISLYKKYESQLMKDFLNRGRSLKTARQELLRALHATWLLNGNAADSWKLDAPDATPTAEPAQQPPRERRAAAELVHADPDKQAVANHVAQCWKQGTESFIFVEGRAGTGKSTLARHITNEAVETGRTVVNVATTGQAALELPDGATAHSTFGIPLADEDDLTCTLGLRSAAALRLAQAAVIQWDEWPSVKKTAWEAVLGLLRALQAQYADTYVPKTFICYGDFRQIPPVVPRASRQTIVQASVRASSSWGAFSSFRLRTVYRQKGDPRYAQWVDRIGDGLAPAEHTADGETGYVCLDPCTTITEESDAVSFCFPALNDPHECAASKILCARNSLVDAHNNRILQMLVQTYRCPSCDKCSCDTIDMDAESSIEPHITAEYLNSQGHPGAPPHCVRLVKGALYELMRNFSPKDRLMNHVPVILREVYDNHVLIETLDGRTFPLPRICFRWQIAGGTSTMTRKQYPLRPAYASSFNGGQGRTFDRCAVDVRHQPFARGRLYAALSRVRHREHVRILCTPVLLTPTGKALSKNIVWPELLLPTSSVPPASACRKRPASALSQARVRR